MTTAAAAATASDKAAFVPIVLSSTRHCLEANQLGLVLTSDEQTLPQPGLSIGTHACCGGNFIAHRATPMANAGVCDKCHYRFEYGIGLKTYADLRRAFEFLV